jgi:DNA-binding LytR/AlgR family response regulator
MQKKNFFNWLDNPFPFGTSLKEKLITSFSFATFVYFFLLIFHPFGIGDVEMNIPLFLSGFFFITLFVIQFISIVLPYFFKKAFDPDSWNVKKSIVFNLGIFASIGFFNWAYNQFFIDYSNNYSLWEFMLMTISVGTIPSAFMVLIFERYYRNKNQKSAINIENRIKKNIVEIGAKEIVIPSENDNEQLVILTSNLLCIKSEGNYVKVFFEEKEEAKHKFLRNSLAKLEDLLSPFSEFKRCHRSYIANFNKIDHLSGNARNYNLHYNKLDFTVPISRSFPKELIYSISEKSKG